MEDEVVLTALPVAGRTQATREVDLPARFAAYSAVSLAGYCLLVAWEVLS